MRKLIVTLTTTFLCLTSLFSAPTLERYVQSQANPVQNQAAAQAASLTELLYSLGNLYSYLDQNFLYEIDNTKMQNAVISAMIDSLGDKYSYYITPDKAPEANENNQGRYVGIGTYLTKVNPTFIDWDDPSTYMVIITSPFPGGPADRSGIRAGDMVSHVDGKEIYDLNATEASKLIRGTLDVPITLTIHRGNSVFDITLIPEVITTPSTSTTMLEDNIGYIAITDFSMTTASSVKEDVAKLLEEGAESLILDVRNNGGGIVDAALSIADMFVPEGKLLLTTKFKEHSSGKDSDYYATSYLAVPETMPLYVLTNGGTASSSEILTAALQQNGRAKVVGTQTFGKGIMQYMIGFMGGYLNLTVANYYTPDGNSIHEIGITPDFINNVNDDYTDEEMEAYADFLTQDYIDLWMEEMSDYSEENIRSFAEKYQEECGVPYDLLCLLLRNEYIYALPYDERPVADPIFDSTLAMAISLIKEPVLEAESSVAEAEVSAE